MIARRRRLPGAEPWWTVPAVVAIVAGTTFVWVVILVLAGRAYVHLVGGPWAATTATGIVAVTVLLVERARARARADRASQRPSCPRCDPRPNPHRMEDQA